MVIVVYSSHTGSSKKYAEILSSKMSYQCYSVKDMPDSDEGVIFIGWIRGPVIVGLSKVDKHRLIAVAAVSLDSNPEFGWPKVKDTNSISCPFYHLPGWIDRKKLNVFEKLLFVFLCARYKLQGLDSHTAPLFDAMMNGGSFFDESALQQLEDFCSRL
jgi:hypothetical protein